MTIKTIEKRLTDIYANLKIALDYKSDIYDDSTLVHTIYFTEYKTTVRLVYHIDCGFQPASTEEDKSTFDSQKLTREYICVKVDNPTNKTKGDYKVNVFHVIILIMLRLAEKAAFATDDTSDNFKFAIKNQIPKLDEDYTNDKFVNSEWFDIISQTQDYTTTLMIKNDYNFLLYSLNNDTVQNNSDSAMQQIIMKDFYNDLHRIYGKSHPRLPA